MGIISRTDLGEDSGSRYKIIKAKYKDENASSAIDTDGLEKRVNELIKDGYEPIGGLSELSHINNLPDFYQVVYKRPPNKLVLKLCKACESILEILKPKPKNDHNGFTKVRFIER